MTSPPDLYYEKKLWRAFGFVAGMDEAGRGALAGPVCVGAVVLPPHPYRLLQALEGARDSKQLTPRKRAQIASRIREAALASSVGFSSALEVDELGIVSAVRLAASRALEALPLFPDFLLTDFRLELPELDISQMALVKGDQLSMSVAAASILAKTARDSRMTELDMKYPQYGFARHKGYGSLAHRRAIAAWGFSPEHRRTFRWNKGEG